MYSYWTNGLRDPHIRFPFSHKQRVISKYLFTNKKIIGNAYSKRQNKRNSMYIIGKILSKITRDTMTISCRVKTHFRRSSQSNNKTLFVQTVSVSLSTCDLLSATKYFVDLYKIPCSFYLQREPRVAQWLRHYATSRTVSGSIPRGVTGDFFRSYRQNHLPWGRLSL